MSLWSRPIRPHLIWFAAGAALFLVVLLYSLGNHVDHSDLYRVGIKIKELGKLDVGRNLDVLRLLQRNKSDYDFLAASDVQGRKILEELRGAFAAHGIEPAVREARLAWEAKQEQIERFKRFNSVLANSHMHFVNLVEKLDSMRSSQPFGEAARGVLVFLAVGGAEDVPVLNGKLEALMQDVAHWPESPRTSGRLLIAHAQVILTHHLRVRQLSNELLTSPMQELLDSAYGHYNAAFAVAEKKAQGYRTTLAALSLLLVAAILLAVLRLRQAAHDLERSFRRLDNIADHLDVGIVACDAQQRITFVNRRGEELLGRSADDLHGASLPESLFGVRQVVEEGLVQSSIRRSESFAGECSVVPSSGAVFPALVDGGPLPSAENGEPAGYVVSFRDLSEIRKAEARLQLAARVFDNLSEGMVITDASARIQSVNSAFASITGYSEAESLGRRPGELLGSGQHGGNFYREMWDALQRNRGWQGEIVNRRRNGELYTEWLSISVVPDASGGVLHYIGLFSDISDRKATEAYIYHLAYHDVLTGLANRLLFQDRLGIGLSQAHRNRRQLAVLLLDLDRFKVVNDTLGHLTGDELLKQVAARLSEQLREGDTLARLGGDEFALVMPEIQTTADAANVARKLIAALQAAVDVDGQELVVTTSIGIAIYPQHGADAEALLQHADLALYEAKDAGRNTYSFFDPDTSGQSRELLELEIDLRHAVTRKQLVLHYQPQIDAASGQVSGVEALVRWQHPTKGLISPALFIPLAEERGSIEEIGAWCLEAACDQLARWKADGLAVPRMAVNVSARQLRSPSFAQRVLTIVRQAGIAPGDLEIELTESSLTEDAVRAYSVFEALRSAGVRVAIDDFGTGYSSLSYLANYPVDVVKIDRSFVANIDGQSEAPYIVRAVILLAHGMNMESVAEGVETEGQRRTLAALGCRTLQGFYFSRPVPPEAIPDLLAGFGVKQHECLG